MTRILNTDFLAAIPSASQKFLKRAGVRAKVTVQCSGDTAYTQFHGTGKNGNIMKVLLNMPCLDASGYMTRAQADLFTAYVLHEISHNLYTDNHQWRDAVMSADYGRQAAAHKILNALEDVRIENVSIRENVAGRFQECLERLIDFLHVRALAGGFNPNGADGMLWTICVLGRMELNGYDIPSAAGIRSKMSAKNNAFVSEILKRLATAKDTADAGKIMLWIMSSINKPAENNKPDTNPGDSDDAQDDENDAGLPTETDNTQTIPGDSDDDAQDDENDDDTPGQPDADEWEDPETDDDAQDDESDAGNGAGLPPETDDESDGGESIAPGVGDDDENAISWENAQDDDLKNAEPDVSDVAKQVGIKRFDAQVLGSVLTKAVVSKEIQAQAKKSFWITAGDLKPYKDGVPVPAKMKTQIRGIVRAPGRLDKRRWQENGRLDLRAVPSMRCGNKNVYKKRRKTEAVNSAVSLLVDLSFSMNGAEIRAAVGLAGHLGECLKSAGVPFEIVGFKGGDKSYMIKSVTEPWNNDAIKNVVTTADAADGSTNISNAIVRAAQRLRGVQNVSRRIILCLTDGGCAYGPQSVQASIKYAETIGVETAGLGLLEDISDVFPLYQNVENVGALGRDGLDVLARALGRAR